MNKVLVSLFCLMVSVCMILGQTCIPTPTPSPSPSPTASPTPTPTPTPGGGDATNGAAIFSSNGCTGCHAADGTGTVIAPNIRNESAASLDAHLRGTDTHPIKLTSLSDQDIADIAAFLAAP